MTVTSFVVQQIEDAMTSQSIQRQELARAVGKGSSWVTKLLNGGIKRIDKDTRFAIEELLGLPLIPDKESSELRTLSPDVYRIAELIERNSQAAEWGRLMLKTFSKPEIHTQHSGLPPLTTREAEIIGISVFEFLTNDRSPLSLGKFIEGAAARVIAAIQTELPPRPVALYETNQLEHRGQVWAGSSGPDLQSRMWPSKKSYPSDHYVLRVYGKAMEPTILDGSDVIVRPYSGTQDEYGTGDLEWGKIFVLRYSSGLRRLEQLQENPPGSGSPLFRPLHVDSNDLSLVGNAGLLKSDLGYVEALYVETHNEQLS